jgi:hypothetical protein
MTEPQSGSVGRRRFLDKQIEAERARYERVSARIDRWWNAFERRRGDIDELFHGKRERKWDLVKSMQACDLAERWIDPCGLEIQRPGAACVGCGG